MVENMKGIGLIIICMDRVSIHGGMEESMMGIIIWIRNMVMEFISGQMEGDMRGYGLMENNMGKENIHHQMIKLEKEFGKRVRELDGLMNKICNNQMDLIKEHFHVS